MGLDSWKVMVVHACKESAWGHQGTARLWPWKRRKLSKNGRVPAVEEEEVIKVRQGSGLGRGGSHQSTAGLWSRKRRNIVGLRAYCQTVNGLQALGCKRLLSSCEQVLS